MRFPKIDRFLTAEGDLQPVFAKAREIRVLSRLCTEFLPPELARHTQAANLKDGRLVLLAANSAAAAKLKLLSETLSEFLSKQGAKVSGVSVRVQPKMSRSVDVAPRKQALLTPASIAELAALHRRMPDSPARTALAALLERHAADATPPPASAQKTAAAGSARRGKGHT